jgi:hypothetical protein
LHAGAWVASRRSGAARPHASPGAALDGTGACVVWALLPGWRVVAPREIDGMPHPTHLTQPQQLWWPVIPEICPPGEGIFWLRADPMRVEYCLAKDRPITDREQGSVLVRGR